MNATEYILQRAEQRAEKRMYFYIFWSIVITALFAFNAGRVYEYAAGYAVSAKRVDQTIAACVNGEYFPPMEE